MIEQATAHEYFGVPWYYLIVLVVVILGLIYSWLRRPRR